MLMGRSATPNDFEGFGPFPVGPARLAGMLARRPERRTRRVALSGPERSREFAWLKTNARRYPGRWVAVSGSELLAHATTLRDLRTALTPGDLARRPLLHFVVDRQRTRPA